MPGKISENDPAESHKVFGLEEPKFGQRLVTAKPNREQIQEPSYFV